VADDVPACPKCCHQSNDESPESTQEPAREDAESTREASKEHRDADADVTRIASDASDGTDDESYERCTRPTPQERYSPSDGQNHVTSERPHAVERRESS
jgi:hypothetical protein